MLYDVGRGGRTDLPGWVERADHLLTVDFVVTRTAHDIAAERTERTRVSSNGKTDHAVFAVTLWSSVFIWLRQVRGELREWQMDPAHAMAETIDTDDIAAH
jgi:hypothetical protein